MQEQQSLLTIEAILSGYANNSVLNWIKGLEHFSFYKGCLIPQLSDADGFDIDLTYTSKEDLLNTLQLLGLKFRVLSEIEPRIIRGNSYSQSEYDRLPKTTSEFDDIAEVGINGIKCRLPIPKGYIRISLRRPQTEKDYWLTNDDEFENACQIEKSILACGLKERITKQYQEYKGYVDKNKLNLILNK